jgi:hypothetical protein
MVAKTICQILPLQTFSLSESEVGAGWPLAVPGQPQDEPVGGCLNDRQRLVRWHLLSVNRPSFKNDLY